MRRLTLLALGLAAACGRPAMEAGPLHLTTSPAGSDTRLTLHADTGFRINARLVPALELADGTVLRFNSAERTADSAYFTTPPTARLAGRHDQVHGTLRASVCQADERVCRGITLSL
ncbi:MAG: hypothetical protein ABJC36_04625 [Gemmatimonadales bacterium]